MSAETIDVAGLRLGLASASARVQASRDRLCDLDAVAGDGDLGATLAIGFAAVDEALAEPEVESDVGELLRKVGARLAQKAPSTIGILLGTAFLRAGSALAGAQALDALAVVTLLEAAAGGVRERGGAEPGQRTILDAMGSATAAAALAPVGAGPVEVLRAAAVGADAGARATVEMKPQHGRAGWIGDRAQGHEDGGARAWAILLDGLVEGLEGRTDA